MRKQTFLQSFAWVGTMLILMGCVFLAIALVMQLVPLSPADIAHYEDGVLQPPTDAGLRLFRLTFLLAFGTPSLILCTVGGVIWGADIARKKRNMRLKEDGVCVTANIIEYASSAVMVNRRRQLFIRCAYEKDRQIYIFKSGLLRMNPSHFLPQNTVKVYYDRENMKRYFVDVDGSVTTKICEL